MKKVFILVTIFLLTLTSISFAETDFSEVEKSPMPSVMDFEKIYEDYEEKEEEFYVIDFDGGYTLPSLVKDPLINKLKSDIEKNLISNRDVLEENYPELFEKFNVEIVSCKDGSKFVALSEKNLATESSAIMKYAILGILALAIIALGGAFYKKSNLSKKRDSKKINNDNFTISNNESTKSELDIINEERDKVEKEISKFKKKYKERISEYDNKEMLYMEEKKALSEQKNSNISNERKIIIDEKLKEREKELEEIKFERENLNAEKENLNSERAKLNLERERLNQKQKEFERQQLEKAEKERIYQEELEKTKQERLYKEQIELEKQKLELEKQKLERDRQNNKQIQEVFKYITGEKNSIDSEPLRRYENKISLGIYSRLEKAEKLLKNSENDEICSPETTAYTTLVEFMLKEATPSKIENKNNFIGVKSRLNELRKNTSITKKIRESYEKFYNDAREKGFFDIRNGSAHTEIIDRKNLEKIRYFLLYEDVTYYGNYKECRFDWLLRMIELNQEKEWKNKQ